MQYYTYYKTLPVFLATRGLIFLMVGIYLYSFIDPYKLLTNFSYANSVGETNILRQFLPTLLHLNFVHLFLNLTAFWILSDVISKKEGGWISILIFIVSGYTGNIAQANLIDPSFLGVSGVVFGQAGFVLMMKFLDTPERYKEIPYTVVLNLGILLFVGFLVNNMNLSFKMANMAHLFGMLGGMAFAFPYYFISVRRKKKK